VALGAGGRRERALGGREGRREGSLEAGRDQLFRRRVSDLIRCITGNPTRPLVADPSWLSWDGGIVVKLATAIYRGWAFDRLPVLADALQDAGCQDNTILDHCRHPGPHARGCWGRGHADRSILTFVLAGRGEQ
jgi:hypothetical protein